MRRKQSKVKIPRVFVDGNVYLIKLGIDGKEVYKVGVTTYSVARRVLGIVEDVWKNYGYFPHVEIIHERRTRNHYGVEANVHDVLRDMGYGYSSGYAFNGSTELFWCDGLDDRTMIDVIDRVVSTDDAVSAESIDRVSDIM